MKCKSFNRMANGLRVVARNPTPPRDVADDRRTTAPHTQPVGPAVKRARMLLFCFLFLLSHGAHAQQPWEFDPYQVRIWMAVDDVPELPLQVQHDILRSIVWQAEIAEPAAWRVAARPAPDRLRYDILRRLDEITADLIKAYDLVVFARPPAAPTESSEDVSAPFTIEELSQLADERLRIGICDPANTQLGQVTKSVLQTNNLWDKIQPNLKSVDTAGLALVKQVLSGKLDAAIVHRFHADRVFSLSSFLSSSMLSGFLDDFYFHPITTSDDSTAILECDKLMLLSIDFVDGQFRVRAREMNCRTQTWGEVADRRAGQVPSIPDAAMDAIRAVFTPVVRIDEVVYGDERLRFFTGSEFIAELDEGKVPAGLVDAFQQQGVALSTSVQVTKAADDKNQWGIKDAGNDRNFVIRTHWNELAVYERISGNFAHCRLRAGGLVQGSESPAKLPEQAILRPIVRRNDRLGRLAPGGIYEVPWTYLTTDVREGSKLTCAVHSSFRNAIRGRSGRRIERFAALVRPEYEWTELRLQTQGNEARPLAGYEVYSRLPEGKASTFLGRTNWQGRMRVRRDESPLHILYLRSAGRLIARLPIVPGFETEQVAALPNDEDRLWAQALLQDLTVEFFDRVAEREVLTAVIRTRIQDGRFDQAETLIERLEAPEFSRSHFYLMLDRVKSEVKENIPAGDRQMHDQINSELTSIRTNLGRRFDPGLPQRLRKELEDAKGFGT